MTHKSAIVPPGKLNFPDIHELWRAREVAIRMAQRDLIVRYRQTILGVAWVVIQPVVAAGVFTIVFGGVAGLQSGEIPYFLFSLAGMLVWNVFSGVLGRTSGALVSNQSLVAKVFFPRLLVPLSTLASVIVDLVVGLALAVILLFVYGVNPGWPVLLVPLWVLLAAGLGLGIGLPLSALMVKYRDVGYVLPWVTQILLYASPVAYALSEVPQQFRWMFDLNPATWFLEGFRWSLLGTTPPPTWQPISLMVVTPLLLVVGTIVFQHYERQFADVI